jgi:DNA-binding CsgD family transcriptional regulator
MGHDIDYDDFFRRILDAFCFDKDLKDYKALLINKDNLDNTILLKNQFFYINDLVSATNIYVHPNIERVTGFPPEEFIYLGRIYELIHPDDRDIVMNFSKRTIEASKDYKLKLKTDPQYAIFTIEFRLQKLSGEYIKVRRNSCCFKTDKAGNMVYALVTFADISDTNKSDNVYFSQIINGNEKICFDDFHDKYKTTIKVTKREFEVLKLLSQGYSNTRISKKMFISIHTVISHRRNLLHKAKVKNTAELIKYAANNNLL